MFFCIEVVYIYCKKISKKKKVKKKNPQFHLPTKLHLKYFFQVFLFINFI